MAVNQIVGAAVAVADGQNTLYARGFGVRDLASREPVTPETVFGCASVSKSFTAMAIMQLADRGALTVDDPVVRHIPEFKLAGAADMAEIKIRHLLSHTTGLPPISRCEDIMSYSKHLSHLANTPYKLLGRPGERFGYTNDTFLLNGLIIERKSGQLFRRYMTGHILDAIDMNRSTYSLEELERLDNVSTPYVLNPATGHPEPQPWPVLGTYEVGGGIRSCVLDLARYGQVFLNGGIALNGQRIVSEEGLARISQPALEVGTNTYYCFGIKRRPDYAGLGITLVEDFGSQPGVSSNFGFVPERGITVAVLTNVSNVPAAAIWLAAVNTALDLPIETRRAGE